MGWLCRGACGLHHRSDSPCERVMLRPVSDLDDQSESPEEPNHRTDIRYCRRCTRIKVVAAVSPDQTGACSNNNAGREVNRGAPTLSPTRTWEVYDAGDETSSRFRRDGVGALCMCCRLSQF